MPAWAKTGNAGQPQNEFDLVIRKQRLSFDGREAVATTVNGSVPGPLLRMREGEEVVLRVRNELDADSSLHWHGILLPPEMDGVPGISFDGIQPGETFEYRYRLAQTGTYWYHSHSGFQEQSGVYAPLIVDPAGPEAHDYERELVILLSDWSFEDPMRIWNRLKKDSEYYNRNPITLSDLMNSPRGIGAGLRELMQWDRMRMSATDIADVTGYTYTYLLNGHGPNDGWQGLFRPGERVRLRIINGSAMTYFNVRIPGLPMTVIQMDGQDVRPVEIDEFQLAVAETLDVIVSPGNQAYAFMAEAMDRSGFAFGSLTPRADLAATPPPLRKRPRRTMADMGHAGMDHAAMDHEAMDHAAMGHDHAAMQASAAQAELAVYREPDWTPRRGPGVANVVDNPSSRLAEPGTGLADVNHRVLNYAQLAAREPFYDARPPTREITLHLTGNMERYMWSFDGVSFSENPEPLRFAHNERLRLVFINHTMMEHPIHLHGMWMELENGQSPMPRKHTVSVKPAEKLSVLVTADAPGDWAFHCHLLLHMKAGMMRMVSVSVPPQEARDAGS